MAAVHTRIEGRVQGVGYRAWVVAMAQSLGLKGFVRNRKDGSVEAVFEGKESALQHMIEKCDQGPIAARVTQVLARERHEEGFSVFSSLPTE